MNDQAKTSRHQTALSRTEVSRPLRLALETGIISSDTSVLDYGCGRGDDVRYLHAINIEATGWDPFYFPDEQLRDADIVNLGYVVNVIENPIERARVLQKAWSLARKSLIVSARLKAEAKSFKFEPYQDGCLTRRGTFQKLFDQHELRDWISAAIGANGVAAAPGVFFVFRDDAARQSYAASRFRRISSIPGPRQSDILFSQYKELLQPLMDFVASRGRLPDEMEVKEAPAFREVFGSIPRAFGVVQRVTGREQWEEIREERSQDLLVYLALERFNGRPRFSALPNDLQLDVKAFFGRYTRACEAADKLLFSAGNMEAIDAACKETPCGKATHEALYIHNSGLEQLSPLLRVYEGCARAYIGNVEGANVTKLNRHIPRISYLAYPDFEKDPHPALIGSLIVSLRGLDVRYRNYDDSPNPPILHRKEKLVPEEHRCHSKFERLTNQEERWGLYENPSMIGRRKEWDQLLRDKGVKLRGHRIVRFNHG